jgi:hypothetical protein
MSVRTGDFLERLGFTLLLAGISFGITYLAGFNEAWALALLAVLQMAKNLIAQRFGDPDTSGFVNPAPDTATIEPHAFTGESLPLDDTTSADE